MKRTLSIRATLLLVCAALLIGVGASRVFSGDSIYDALNKYQNVLSLTQKYYVDDVDLAKLNEAAINGLLAKLDPHSIYLPPVQAKSENERFQGSYQGVGLEIAQINDTITVVEPMGGGPATRLGILSNDRIVTINDTSAIGWTTQKASDHLRGPKGTIVKVAIKRPDLKDLLTYDITRDNIAQNSVDVAMMMGDGIGYVAVNRFSATTDNELSKALTDLTQQGMKRLVLDLRDNPGGLLDQAVGMADMFLDGGTKEHPHVIVYTKARVKELEEGDTAHTGDPYEKLPLILLVNNGSASASEIVTGAIQDWDRGLVVGVTTFGKGLVQRAWTFPDGSTLRLTIARYYTPSGRLIQRSYTGKSILDYETEAYQRNEQEGSNLEHSEDEHETKDSTRPRFKTASGRTVYGGGGISPDYIEKGGSLTEMAASMVRRDAFYPYVVSYMDKHQSELKSKYGDDSHKFADDFRIDDDMLKDFKAMAEKRGVKLNDTSFTKDGAWIKARIKAYVGQNLYGNLGWYPVMLGVDPQFQKAITLFPEAQKIAGLTGESDKKN